MTEGQRSAIAQLRRVEAASDGSLEVLSVEPEAEGALYVDVVISVDCSSIPRVSAGLALRGRERLIIRIRPDFPFQVPSIRTSHTRWGGFPHVQWQRQPCLYLSPSTEWDPNDGMFGFLDRMHEWLTQAAANELDPVGAALHPPVAYPTVDKMVIPRVDTPTVDDAPWLGAAQLKVVSDPRVEVTGWLPLFGEDPPADVAAVILLAEAMPFEFPKTVRDLLTAVEERGVERRLLLLILQYAAVHNRKDEPLYVLLGTPMRGIRGSGDLKQHLTAWHIDPTLATGLRLSVDRYHEDLRLQKLGARVEEIIWEWADAATVGWCSVQEQRPEIVTRRDVDRATSWFIDRTVSIWGCGALGTHVAEFVARAGAKKLILVDNDKVTPGILVRQRFEDGDVGEPKVEALEASLKRIQPDLEVEARHSELLSGLLASEDWTSGSELLIDTSAAQNVLKKLELRCHSTAGLPIPVVSMVVGPRAQRGLAALAQRGHSGGPRDVLRRANVETQGHNELAGYNEVFWPDPQERRAAMFQPEPGCSSPTFVGSAADVASLAGMMLNSVAAELAADNAAETAVAHFVGQPQTLSDEEPAYGRLAWRPDRVVPDRRAGYEVRLSEAAWAGVQRWIQKSRRRRGPAVETGGLLIGDRDDAAKVIWISEVSGPPPDSSFSEEGFVCGRVGTEELCQRKRDETNGALGFVGMWHTHPLGPPEPSQVDLNGMSRVLNSLEAGSRNPLLLIVGHAASDPEIGAHVFLSDELVDEGGVAVAAWRGLRRVRYGIISVVYVGGSRMRGTLRSWYDEVSERLSRIINRG